MWVLGRGVFDTLLFTNKEIGDLNFLPPLNNMVAFIGVVVSIDYDC